MNIQATVKKVTYRPLLCARLPQIAIAGFSSAFQEHASFILEFGDQNRLAVSRWVSAKRTRSYPYARVYDTLSFTGKKVTVIPVYKDEGFDGDRDYLQWDTISLMSLLGVYVIIGYYSQAVKNPRFAHKITSQRFELDYIRSKLEELRHFQSDALHWNLAQCENIQEVAFKALNAYRRISQQTGVKMHSEQSALERIFELSQGAEYFKFSSRINAQAAQGRESITRQPKEFIASDRKATITMTNYLGGEYHLTADEAWIEGDCIFLAECKHSRTSALPSLGDIKDGLLKMVLFCNIEDVSANQAVLKPRPVLRLTSSFRKDDSFLHKASIQLLLQEAETNGFSVWFQ